MPEDPTRKTSRSNHPRGTHKNFFQHGISKIHIFYQHQLHKLNPFQEQWHTYLLTEPHPCSKRWQCIY